MPASSETTFDALVIGAGLGGLTCAMRLADAGHRVLLLEQHFQLGGLAAWFKRGGHIFDVSLHGFPYGMVKTCKKYWGKTIQSAIVQLKNIVFDNPQFSLTTTFSKDDFIRILTTRFGVAEATVAEFFAAVEGMNFYDDQAMRTRELFARFFPNRNDIHRLLMEPISYANGSTLDEPAITYGIVFSNFMNRGVFTFEGGTDRLIALMRAELEKLGVDIRTKTTVERIVVERGRVTGVVANGAFIPGRAVISNSGVTNTVRMAGADAFSPGFMERFDRVRVNNSSCQVYFGIRKGETIPDIGDLLFTSTEPEFTSEALRDFHTKSRTFSLYYPKTRPEAPPDYTIVASMNANSDDWADFDDAEYARQKALLAERCLADLERYLPGIRKKIDVTEAATPRTFRRYTLHEKGTSFGTKFEGLEISRGLFQEVGGLFHTGSVGIIMSGWLGAINYGVIVANDVDAWLHEV